MASPSSVRGDGLEARDARRRNVVSAIVSSTSASPTKSSRKLVPEDWVATDVASSSPCDAQDASDRNGRPSAGAAAGVGVWRVGVCFLTVCAGLRVLVCAETDGVEVIAGVETGVDLRVTTTVVEATFGA
jgi:hypothetical protein